MNSCVSISLSGDIMCGRLLNKSKQLDYKEKAVKIQDTRPWAGILSSLKKSDITIANLECVFFDTSSEKTSVQQLCFNHRCDLKNINILKEAGLSCCSLANNHILDCGKKGLIETLKILKQNEIKYCGAGKNLHAAWKPAIITLHQKSNIKIAVFSVADHYREWASLEHKPGICYFDVENFVLSSGNPNTYMWNSLDFINEQILSVRSKVNLIVMSIHWGSNFGWKPKQKFQDFAHHLIDNGVDVIHGHSSHHIQGIEIYKDCPIIYGCGDFLNDYDVFDAFIKENYEETLGSEFQSYKSHLSFLYQLYYTKSVDSSPLKISHIDLIPICINNCSVSRATGEDWKWLKDKVIELSQEFNTNIQFQENGELSITIK